jgi:putative cell wall-binding protein
VYLANGQKYPDALSAASLAGSENAPLLLTEPGTLPQSIRDAITAVEPEKVVILGGPDSVSDSVMGAVTTLVQSLDPSATVERVAGVNRYATSQLISSRFVASTRAYVATGQNFPDALSAAAAAGDVAAPVILVDGAAPTLDTATRDLLVGLGVTDVRITGSSLSVSNGIANAIDAIPNVSVQRLEGSNRYTTSVAINQNAFSTSTSAYLAVGTGFADALSGAALAGQQGVPLFVVHNNCVPQETLAAMKAMGVTTVHLLGSSSTLDANVFALRNC